LFLKKKNLKQGGEATSLTAQMIRNRSIQYFIPERIVFFEL